MLEGATDGIWVKDTEGRYRMWNRSGARILGIDADNAVGKNDFELFPSDVAQKIVVDDSEILESGQEQTVEDVHTLNGVARTFETKKAPCYDANGQVVALIGVFQDVTVRKLVHEELRNARTELRRKVHERTADLARTNESLRRGIAERKRIEEALIAAKEEAELANRAKSEFLANTSHELRTPLNAIIGFAEMMAGGYAGKLSAKQAEYVSDIRESGAGLLEIINDILDLTKIESGQAQFTEENLKVAATVASAVRLIRARADAAGLRLEVDAPGNLPLLRADPRMVKRILLNLLSNAVKFTPPGGEIALSASVDEDGALRFSVRDTGIGISAEDLPKVVEPFGQVDSTLSRRYRGAGLGLSLVKTMCELHGGTLALASELGTGTTVTVRFPPERVLD